MGNFENIIGSSLMCTTPRQSQSYASSKIVHAYACTVAFLIQRLFIGY